MVSLGPFKLVKPIGRGGMATVWKARHHGSGTAVAVKVLAEVLDGQHKTWFRREVRGQAGLRHPGIALVLEYGEVPEELGGQSDLVAGAPWLAMEFASAGPVGQLRRARWPWRMLRELLLSLLDALAHAHARGVIHRDVKLGNLLMASANDLRPGLKLCDFGIAWSPGGRAALAGSGTPRYMAPEQIAAQGLLQGPWTDLYSVGVVGWRLAHGRFPHEAPFEELLELKRKGPPRAGTPPGYPRAFGRWLRRMLAGSPEHRYLSAADAARALAALEDPRDAVVVPKVELDLFAATGRLEALEPGRKVQRTWKRGAVQEIPVQLTGAGLGVWSIRSPPMVGRVAARTALWEELRAVDEDNRPRVAVVRGPAGVGKTRLGRWLAERGEEVGAAVSWTLGAGGLPAMVRGGLGAGQLGGTALRDSVRAAVTRLGGTAVDASMAVALVGDGEDPDSGVRVQQSERLAAAVRLMQLQASQRPLIVRSISSELLGDAVQLSNAALEAKGDFPVLVVIEVRDETLVQQILHRALVQDLAEHPRCRTVRLRPLGSRERQKLVMALLPLEPGLEGQVVSRAGGNPMLTVQLLRALVQRQALVSTAAGFALRPGSSADLSLDIVGAWQDRVRDLIRPAGESAWEALELAAVLGLTVEVAEWRKILGGEQALCDAVRDVLVDQHLWIAEADGRVSWAHGMLREAVLSEAREGGRLEAIHLRVAAALEPDPWDPDLALRQAEHLLAGDREAEAAGSMVKAALEVSRQWSRSQFAVWMARIESAVAAKAAGPDDVLYLDLALLRVRLRYFDGDMRALGRLVQEALEKAEALGDAQRTWQFRRDLIVNLRILSETERALAEARTLVQTAADDPDRCVATEQLARCLLDLGRLDEGIVEANRAEAMLAALNPPLPPWWPDIAELQGVLHMSSGDMDAANAAFNRFLEGGKAFGSLHKQASAWNSLGEVARLTGRLEEAEACYQRAIEYWEPQGATNTPLVALNLGMVAVAREDFAGALRWARSFDVQASDAARRWLITTWRALRVAGFAGLGRPDLAERERVALAREVLDTGRSSLDEPWLLERAADALRTRGQPWHVFLGDAAAAWERVGRPADAERVRRGIPAG